MAKPKYKYYYKNQLIAESTRDSYRYALVCEKEDGSILKFSLSNNFQALERHRKKSIEACYWFAYDYSHGTQQDIAREKRLLEYFNDSKIVELERI